MMRLPLLVVVLCLILLGAGAGFLAHSIRSGSVVQSETNPAGGQVLAKVDGTDITLGQLALADEEMAAQLAQLPENVRFQYLLSMLIDRRIMELAAKKEGLESDPQVAQRKAYFNEKALRDVYWIHAMNKYITPESIRAYYDSHFADLPPEAEVHAAHILVATREEAEAALASIRKGKAFADVAKAVSKDGAAANGGDLGWFKKGEMIPEFSEAAFKLKPGELSGPVQTSVGWHVIKLIDTREGSPKTLEEAQAEIVQALSREHGRELIEKMRNEAEIEVVGAAGQEDDAAQADETTTPDASSDGGDTTEPEDSGQAAE